MPWAYSAAPNRLSEPCEGPSISSKLVMAGVLFTSANITWPSTGRELDGGGRTCFSSGNTCDIPVPQVFALYPRMDPDGAEVDREIALHQLP